MSGTNSKKKPTDPLTPVKTSISNNDETGIDPTTTARALWLETHPLPAISDKVRVEDPTSAIVNKPIEKAAASQ